MTCCPQASVSFWPMVTDDAIFGVAGVTNYLGTVRHAEDGAERIRVELELAGDVAAGDREALVRSVGERLHASVGLRMEVVVAAALPAFVDTESKAHRWRDVRIR